MEHIYRFHLERQGCERTYPATEVRRDRPVTSCIAGALIDAPVLTGKTATSKEGNTGDARFSFSGKDPKTEFINYIKKRCQSKEIDFSFSQGNEWTRSRGLTFNHLMPFSIHKIQYGVNIIMSSFPLEELTEGWDALEMDSPADRIGWLLSAKFTDLPMEDANYLATVMTWDSYIDTFYAGHDIRPSIASFRETQLDGAIIVSLVFSS